MLISLHAAQLNHLRTLIRSASFAGQDVRKRASVPRSMRCTQKLLDMLLASQLYGELVTERAQFGYTTLCTKSFL